MVRSTSMYLRKDFQESIDKLYDKYLKDNTGLFVVLQGNQRLPESSQWETMATKIQSFLNMLSIESLEYAIWGYDKYKNGYPHVNMVLILKKDFYYDTYSPEEITEIKSKIYHAWITINHFDVSNGFFPTSVNLIKDDITVRKDPRYTIQYIMKRAQSCQKKLIELQESRMVRIYHKKYRDFTCLTGISPFQRTYGNRYTSKTI